jgi:hypothetical protein
MNKLLDKVLAWYVPPTPTVAFRAGQISRGLAHFKSVGCSIRNGGKCPYELVLYGCAGCTLQREASISEP